MNEFKGTPGPWSLADIDDDDISEMSSTMIVASGVCVACVGPSGNTSYGDDINNSLLIAAAPELLEALRELLNEYESIVSHEFNSSCLDVDPDYLRAKAAIAKALGETK